MEHYLIKHPFWIRLLDQIMPFWQKDDLSQIIRWATQTPSAKVIIFPVCYATCPTHLTTATREILLSAISWQKQLPRAHIVVGNYDILTDTEMVSYQHTPAIHSPPALWLCVYCAKASSRYQKYPDHSITVVFVFTLLSQHMLSFLKL